MPYQHQQKNEVSTVGALLVLRVEGRGGPYISPLGKTAKYSNTYM